MTRLIRPGSSEPDEFLYAPPELLGQWLVENWWRLRWEPQEAKDAGPATDASPGWKMAHQLRAIGGGYSWPNVAFWGEDDSETVEARADPIGVAGPVRFLAEESPFAVAAADFEAGVDRFLRELAGADGGFAQRAATLWSERGDPEQAAWRRLEAKLGFDADAGPVALMEEFATVAERFPELDVEEAAAAAPGLGSAAALHEAICAANGPFSYERVSDSGARSCGWSRALQANAAVPGPEPWQLAEEAALGVRQGISGPLRDGSLGDLVGVPSGAFEAPRALLRYGMRVVSAGRERVVARSRWRVGRRFEFARALGDAIWESRTTPAGESALGPIARSKTSRQKFQRAFAAALLCPIDDLLGFMNTDSPEDDDIAAASEHFGVSEFAVESTLVNHQAVARSRFPQIALSGI